MFDVLYVRANDINAEQTFKNFKCWMYGLVVMALLVAVVE